MSPKIYLIKNQKDQFLNLENKDPYFTNFLHQGSYGTQKNKVELIIKHVNNIPDFKNIVLEVFETTELEFTTELANTTTSLVLQLDSIARKLESLRNRLPTITQLNKNLYKHLKNSSDAIKIINPHFKLCLNVSEDNTDEVTEYYEEMINELSKVDLWECHNISEILKAKKKSGPSIMGVVKKINS